MNEFHPLDRIRELCEERGWSYYQLSRESGIPYSTLNTMMLKSNMPTLPTLLRLCNGFGISMAQFFEPEESFSELTPDQRQCLSMWDALSSQDKQLASAYMNGLLKRLA